MKVAVLILAGGYGERLWPKSRKNLPKQFLAITHPTKTMIQLTAERFTPSVLPENIFVITNIQYKKLAQTQLCNNSYKIPKENIFLEPCFQNTAPAVALAIAFIEEKLGDCTVFVCASDSKIENNEEFLKTFNQCVKIAEKGENFVMVGAEPTYAETGFGYIQMKNSKNWQNMQNGQNVFEVENYTNKPNAENAQKYVKSGEYLWNTCMLSTKISFFNQQFEHFSPEIFKIVKKIAKNPLLFTKEEYEKCPLLSLDTALLQKCKNILLVKATFNWDDVGSWNAISRMKQNSNFSNTFIGDVVAHNCKNTLIETNKKLVAAIGLDDLIVIDTDDALLICKQDQCQNIKEILEKLKKQNRMAVL